MEREGERARGGGARGGSERARGREGGARADRDLRIAARTAHSEALTSVPAQVALVKPGMPLEIILNIESKRKTATMVRLALSDRCRSCRKHCVQHAELS